MLFRFNHNTLTGSVTRLALHRQTADARWLAKCGCGWTRRGSTAGRATKLLREHVTTHGGEHMETYDPPTNWYSVDGMVNHLTEHGLDGERLRAVLDSRGLVPFFKTGDHLHRMAHELDAWRPVETQDYAHGIDGADLLQHVGHDIEVVTYGLADAPPVNVAVECVTCSTVLTDTDLGGGDEA